MPRDIIDSCVGSSGQQRLISWRVPLTDLRSMLCESAGRLPVFPDGRNSTRRRWLAHGVLGVTPEAPQPHVKLPLNPRRLCRWGFSVKLAHERTELLVLRWPNILARFGFDRCGRQPVHPGFPDPFGKMRADQQKASKQRGQRKPGKPSSARASVTEKESQGRATCSEV